MKRYFFILLLVCSTIVYGQDYIGHISTLIGAHVDTSIVRSVGPDVCVVYTGKHYGENYFHVVNVRYKQVWSFTVDEEVKDVEVMDDTVYYCGWQGFPSICSFPIAQVYTGAVDVDYVWYMTSTTIVPKRLEVFRVVDGVHAVMVGDWADATPTNSFIADAWKPYGSSYWYVAALKTEGKEVYDDIAVTDNYVVASASNYGSQEIITRVLTRPVSAMPPTSATSANNNIFYYCTTSGCPGTTFFYSGTYPRVSGGYGKYLIRLAHTRGDMVALSCMSTDNYGRYGVTLKELKVSAGIPSIIRDCFFEWGNVLDSYWNMRDVRYDKVRDSLLFLVDWVWPSYSTNQKQMVARVDYGLYSTMKLTSTLLEMPELHSLDMHIFKDTVDEALMPRGIVSSGFLDPYVSTYSGIWSNNRENGTCEETDRIWSDVGGGKMTKDDLPSNDVVVSHFIIRKWHSVVTQGQINVRCMNE